MSSRLVLIIPPHFNGKLARHAGFYKCQLQRGLSQLFSPSRRSEQTMQRVCKVAVICMKGRNASQNCQLSLRCSWFLSSLGKWKRRGKLTFVSNSVAMASEHSSGPAGLPPAVVRSLRGSCDQRRLGFHDGRDLKCRSATLASGKRLLGVSSL